MWLVIGNLVSIDLDFAVLYFYAKPHLSFTTTTVVLKPRLSISAYHKTLKIRRFASKTMSAIVSTTLEIHFGPVERIADRSHRFRSNETV